MMGDREMVKGEAGRSNARSTRIETTVKEGLAAGHKVAIRVTSGSMAPLIAENDRVGVVQVQPDSVLRGEVVVISGGEGWITHRLLDQINRDRDLWLSTKGDNSPLIDPYWRAEALIGRVVSIEREGRTLFLDRGWGAFFHWPIKKLVVGEWKLSNRFPGNSFRRIASRSSRWIARQLGLLAWLTR